MGAGGVELDGMGAIGYDGGEAERSYQNTNLLWYELAL